ncbi:Uncharacterised protein [Serratia ficaria]|uniref:Uncharacterized protein n=1 Tax=Serratia ficaria TaxID=61651 RepID=A0A240C092_SERFI|nr:Uncharacterised protein [Serratia ficaria]CAI0831208.1 Uncharacterised protein [Serratia ficaria]CAI0844522.1 Uncharacterised protein [Serratia ficaria]CAI1841922.1 Uncharacterised protein [Serratia ficaria]SNW01350.1 Uncharacterised protein [Serratia ficaria]
MRIYMKLRANVEILFIYLITKISLSEIIHMPSRKQSLTFY